MFIKCLFMLMSIGIVLAGCKSAEPDNATKIMSQLTDIKNRLTRIEKQLTKAKEQDQQKFPKFDHRRTNPEALEKIKFPEKPDKDNLRKYVRAILTASKKQNIFSSNDVQVEMLARVGSDHVDILINALTDSIASFHLVYAINLLASDKDKTAIIKRLNRFPNLVQAVLKNGWENDAKTILLNRLEVSQHIPREWLMAVISLNDKSNYPSLINYFINGSNKFITYEVIKNLPGIDLDKAIIEAWKNATNQWDIANMSTLVLKFGKKEALDTLITNLDNPKYSYHNAKMRLAVIRHSEATGSNKNIREWYEKNREKLYFDQTDKKFRVKPASVIPVAKE